MNASYQIGLTILSKNMRRALGACTSPDLFFDRLLQKQVTKAKEITLDGKLSAAVTVIVPSESSVIIDGSFNSVNLTRQDSLIEDNIVTPEDEPVSFIK